MELHIHKTVCDRCGAEYKPQPEYERGKYWIGRHLYKLFGICRCGKAGEHEIRVYWAWWDGYQGVNKAAIVDLCPMCRDELRDWMINDRERDDA